MMAEEVSKKQKIAAIEVGYWSIRGLAAPLRMMVSYAGHPLHSVNYDLKEKAEGGFDGSSWFDHKPILKEMNPLMNLPYVKDGEKVIVQTNACFMYLGRKFNMLGNSEEELEQCEELLCEVMDLRNKMTGFAYNPNSDKSSAGNLLNDVTSQHGIFSKFELWLSREVKLGRSGTFLVGDTVTAPDFHLYEMIDQYDTLANFFSFPKPLAAFPHVAAFKEKFASLPNNSKYFASKLSKMPFNNKSAQFGATCSGDKWTHGLSYNADDVSGVYYLA